MSLRSEPVREEIIDLQGVLRDPARSNSYQVAATTTKPTKEASQGEEGA